MLDGQNLNAPDLIFKLSVANAIKATGRIEEYLTPEKIVEYKLDLDSPEIKELIKLTKNPRMYLFEGQDINDPNLQLNMANIIKGTGRIEKYLKTGEPIEELETETIPTSIIPYPEYDECMWFDYRNLISYSII